MVSDAAKFQERSRNLKPILYMVEVFDYNVTKPTMVPRDIVPDAYAAGTGVHQSE